MVAARSVTARCDVAERLGALIRLSTVSDEIDDDDVQAFVALLRELYPHLHAALEFERIGERGLLYRWPGKASADPVVLMAHFDVVPPGPLEDWSHAPFEGIVRDGFVFGRGALDDKGPLVCVLEAVENLAASGFAPARDVYLSFGGDEEVFGSAARLASETLHERGVQPWLVIDEGGAVIDAPLPGVRGQAAMIGLSEKGILSLELRARGTGGHAAAPPRSTPVQRISRAIGRLAPSTFRPRMSATVRAMLRSVAESATGVHRMGYRALAAVPFLGARVLALLGGEPAALVRTTIAATMLNGGTARNVLPSEASVTLNLRICVGETVGSVVSRVRRRVNDPGIEITVVESEDPSPESSAANAQFDLMRHALAASYPAARAVPYVMMQASDSRHFHRHASQVYRFAPLAMDAELRASIHGADERVSINSLERGELFYHTLLTGIEDRGHVHPDESNRVAGLPAGRLASSSSSRTAESSGTSASSGAS